MIISLEYAKRHLNRIDVFDDELINDKIAVAEQTARNYTGDDLDFTDETAPADVKQAIAELVAYYMADRGTEKLPFPDLESRIGRFRRVFFGAAH